MAAGSPNQARTYSLRRYYLFGSAFIAAVLLLVSLGAFWHVSRVTADNSAALVLADQLSRAIDDIGQALQATDVSIQDSASSPDAFQPGQMLANLQRAQEIAGRIADVSNPTTQRWRGPLDDLGAQISDLQQALAEYVELRKDPRWVYPALPYINETLLQANTGFERELTLALHEAGQSVKTPSEVAIFTELSALRDLWRRMILNFRAVMIRFAGLPNIDPTPEERNIEQIFGVIQTRLSRLTENAENLPLGLQTETSLLEMQDFAERWFGGFAGVKQLRAESQWRGDIRHIEQQLRPRQQDIRRTLNGLRHDALAWSAQTTAEVREAAALSNSALWAVSGAGVLLIILFYFSLERGLLRPVAELADGLAAMARGQSESRLPTHGSREITTLVQSFDDMRRQIQARQQALEFNAVHDVLTGLPNRALLGDRLHQAIASTMRDRLKATVLLLDLDRFKEINDTLGHQMGDLVLQQVAERLTHLLRDSDTVARLGGDEFALVLPGMDRAAAMNMAGRVAAVINQPFEIAGRTLYAGVSIGIVVAPEDGIDAETLIRRADSAMYTAKRGKRRYAFFDAKQDERATADLLLVGQLRTALQAARGLQLYYQPKLDPTSNRIVGAEALLRWRKDDGQWVSPERIVQVAENANIMADVTDWVLHRAAADCASFRQQGMEPQVAVNLSPGDLQDRKLPERVIAILAAHQIPATQLVLEVTENAMLARPEVARQVMKRLSGQGIRLSIDDFGTGFSSLAHLKLLPVDELKIDKSFVQNMRQDEQDAVIVRSTIDLGHNLGLKVVAEGVEDVHTLNLLRGRKCDLIQGYLISPPLPPDEFLALMRGRHAHVKAARDYLDR